MDSGSARTQINDGELTGRLRQNLPSVLPDFLRAQRWFAGKASQIAWVDIVDIVSLDEMMPQAGLVLIEVHYAQGLPERYAVPILVSRRVDPTVAAARDTLSMICDDVVVQDAMQSAEFLSALLGCFRMPRVWSGSPGRLEAKTSPIFRDLLGRYESNLRGYLLKSEQSNSSIRYNDKLILKMFRRLSEGINPELEMGAFLTERAHFEHVPQNLGSLSYYKDDSEFTLGVVQEFIPNEGNAWNYTLRQFDSFCGKAVAARGTELPPGSELPEAWFGSYLDDAEMLGRITAEMHLALASDSNDPDFAPETWLPSFRRESEERWVSSAKQSFELLRRGMRSLPPDSQLKANSLLERERQILDLFQMPVESQFAGMIMRIHGDYHLGQVLRSHSDFVIIDFEGEPARPIRERRAKQSPLKDVAGMLRSFDYAAHASSLISSDNSVHLDSAAGARARLSDAWTARTQSKFMQGYLARAGQAKFLPQNPNDLANLLKVYLLEKAIYELSYELSSRPTWIGIPLNGIRRLLVP